MIYLFLMLITGVCTHKNQQKSGHSSLAKISPSGRVLFSSARKAGSAHWLTAAPLTGQADQDRDTSIKEGEPEGVFQLYGDHTH